MVKWEYHTCFLSAEADMEREELRQRWPESNFRKHAPQALVPTLNKYGEKGWELVSMEPVRIGSNEDIQIPVTAVGKGFEVWAHSYLCIFKRPREE